MIKWEVVQLKLFSSELKKAVSALWKKEFFSNPFSSPSFIELMVKKVTGRGETVVFAKGYGDNDQLSALWMFRLDKQKKLYCYNNTLDLGFKGQWQM